MTSVRAQCPACGDVKLQIQDLTVLVCADDATPGSYRFRCPSCSETVQRAASARIVDLLVSAGAPHELWRWPAELDEHPDGPALTPDDLLDLHMLLNGDGWFDELVALVRRTTPG
ncbi:MAG TPA: hypothetical protein VH986_06495 [Acidimicrobiia bacterium]|jgi:predicted RNA-binding Zn-ribbon protein involved in translation (DUF1610 family)